MTFKKKYIFIWLGKVFSSVQSVIHVQLFCDPMDGSTPGLPVHHQLPEYTPLSL